MKATDLRVTNFVLNDGIVNTVIFIGYDAVMLVTPQGNQIQASLDRIQPIPLTPEWLVKFGFVRGREDTDSNVYYGKGKQLFDIMFNTRNFLMYKMVVIGTPILYVHQIQNIIYSLTGQELEIK